MIFPGMRDNTQRLLTALQDDAVDVLNTVLEFRFVKDSTSELSIMNKAPQFCGKTTWPSQSIKTQREKPDPASFFVCFPVFEERLSRTTGQKRSICTGKPRDKRQKDDGKVHSRCGGVSRFYEREEKTPIQYSSPKRQDRTVLCAVRSCFSGGISLCYSFGLSGYALLNFSFGCLHLGQRQSSGRSSNATPSCSAGSYT